MLFPMIFLPVCMKHHLLTGMQPIKLWLTTGRASPTTLRPYSRKASGAVRVVEPAYKLVKKGDEEIEVPDGLKGRIIPFELVQQEKFQDELKAIAGLQMRVEEISGELDENP